VSKPPKELGPLIDTALRPEKGTKRGQSGILPWFFGQRKKKGVLVKQNSDITQVKNVGSTDWQGGKKLPIWLIRSVGNEDYILVFIVHKRIEVDIYLTGRDADELKKYIESSKEVVRSVRIVNR
jgi:hypothetical protein